MNANQRLTILLRVFLPFMLGYALTAFFNQINATLAPFITKDIQLSTTNLGLMTAVYLLAFALAQLPIGILLDRFGSRRVQTLLFLIAALGAWIFANAHQVMSLILGRALIGIGMAAGLMAAFKAIAQWLPKERQATANGLLMSLGTLGALASTSPVAMLLHYLTWRTLFVTLTGLILIIAFIIYTVVPEQKIMLPATTLQTQLAGLKIIFTHPLFWRLAPVTALVFGCNMAMVGLWAGAWFREVVGLSIHATANHLFVLTLALIAGIVASGFMADFANRVLQQSITRLIGASILCFLIIQSLIIFGHVPGSYLLWIAFGFFNRSTTLAYTALTQAFPSEYAGRAITALNLCFFSVAFLTQFSIGLIIDHWQPLSQGYYPANAYRTAFTIILILQIVAFIWFLLASRVKKIR